MRCIARPIATLKRTAPIARAAPSSGLRTAGRTAATDSLPIHFASGRYQVRRFLGEGAKKRVYLATDTRLSSEVAFALIKAEGLDADGQARVRREIQAMGRLRDHPHIVSVFDVGEEGDLVADVRRQCLLRSRDDDVGMDTDAAQFVHRVLRRLRLQLL